MRKLSLVLLKRASMGRLPESVMSRKSSNPRLYTFVGSSRWFGYTVSAGAFPGRGTGLPPDLERSEGDVVETAFMGEGCLVGVLEEKGDGERDGDHVCALSLAQSRGSAPGVLPC